MKIYLQLFWTFFKIGLFTFGGGYAMLPLLQDEVVRKKGWASENDLMDYYSLGLCTPGIIAINVATFIGYYRAGNSGATAATLGIVTPSVIVITLIAAVLQKFMANPYVAHAFEGISLAVVALIADMLLDLGRKNIRDWLTAAVFVIALGLMVIAGWSPAAVVLAAIAAGLIPQREKKQ